MLSSSSTLEALSKEMNDYMHCKICFKQKVSPVEQNYGYSQDVNDGFEVWTIRTKKENKLLFFKNFNSKKICGIYDNKVNFSLKFMKWHNTPIMKRINK